MFGHFDLKSADAINAVHRTKIPILLLHGESDLLVPCDMSKIIAENASGQIFRETFPCGDMESAILSTRIGIQKLSIVLQRNALRLAKIYETSLRNPTVSEALPY